MRTRAGTVGDLGDSWKSVRNALPRAAERADAQRPSRRARVPGGDRAIASEETCGGIRKEGRLWNWQLWGCVSVGRPLASAINRDTHRTREDADARRMPRRV